MFIFSLASKKVEYGTHTYEHETESGSSPHGRRLRAGLIALVLITALLGAQSALAATIGVREVGTGLTEIFAEEGDTVSLELFIDTEGLSFEGYIVGVDITGGDASGISVLHQTVPGLIHQDLLGPIVIDEGLGTIRDINQMAAFSSSLNAGTYVVDIITFTVDNYASSLLPEILVTPGLFGGSLGLDSGSCPGTVPGCTVNVSSVSIVPEPSTAVSLGLGLVGLRAARRRIRLA